MTGIKSTVLVISPLNTIINQQVEFLRKGGLQVQWIQSQENMSTQDKKAIKSGDISILFASPESALTKFGRSVLMRKPLKDQLVAQVYDEAHCIPSWGFAWRPQYSKVDELVSLIPKPILCLSGTLIGLIFLSIILK